MKINLILVRHGQSVLNQARKFQGEDTPLSVEGKQQAVLVAKRLQNQIINHIYSSVNIRAYETAKIINKYLNLPLTPTKLLVEWHKPSDIQGLGFDDPKAKKILDEYNSNRHDPDYHYSDDQTFNQVVERVDHFLSLITSGLSDQSVLAVTHGHFLRMTLLRIVLGSKITPVIFWDAFPTLHHANTGISEFEYNDEKGWRLITWNDTTHL